jgi:hypothetical protein
LEKTSENDNTTSLEKKAEWMISVFRLFKLTFWSFVLNTVYSRIGRFLEEIFRLWIKKKQGSWITIAFPCRNHGSLLNTRERTIIVLEFSKDFCFGTLQIAKNIFFASTLLMYKPKFFHIPLGTVSAICVR